MSSQRCLSIKKENEQLFVQLEKITPKGVSFSAMIVSAVDMYLNNNKISLDALESYIIECNDPNKLLELQHSFFRIHNVLKNKAFELSKEVA